MNKYTTVTLITIALLVGFALSYLIFEYNAPRQDTQVTLEPEAPEYTPDLSQFAKPKPAEVLELQETLDVERFLVQNEETYTLTSKLVGLPLLGDLILQDFTEFFQFDSAVDVTVLSLEANNGNLFPTSTLNFVTKEVEGIDKTFTQITAIDLDFTQTSENGDLYTMEFITSAPIESMTFQRTAFATKGEFNEVTIDAQTVEVSEPVVEIPEDIIEEVIQ